MSLSSVIYEKEHAMQRFLQDVWTWICEDVLAIFNN